MLCLKGYKCLFYENQGVRNDSNTNVFLQKFAKTPFFIKHLRWLYLEFGKIGLQAFVTLTLDIRSISSALSTEGQGLIAALHFPLKINNLQYTDYFSVITA